MRGSLWKDLAQAKCHHEAPFSNCGRRRPALSCCMRYPGCLQLKDTAKKSLPVVRKKYVHSHACLLPETHCVSSLSRDCKKMVNSCIANMVSKEKTVLDRADVYKIWVGCQVIDKGHVKWWWLHFGKASKRVILCSFYCLSGIWNEGLETGVPWV